MEEEDFPLVDSEVAPIASPDETCIDICAQATSPIDSPYPAFDSSHEYQSNPEAKHIQQPYYQITMCSDA